MSAWSQNVITKIKGNEFKVRFIVSIVIIIIVGVLATSIARSPPEKSIPAMRYSNSRDTRV